LDRMLEHIPPRPEVKLMTELLLHYVEKANLASERDTSIDSS